MSVNENILPATTACKQPHSIFSGNQHNLRPSTVSKIWASDGVARRAGVSAMGFGGINTHVTIEETPAPTKTTVPVPESYDFERLNNSQDAELFLFCRLKQQLDKRGGLIPGRYVVLLALESK